MATFVPHIVFFWVEYSVQSRIFELDKSGIDTPSIVNFIKKTRDTPNSVAIKDNPVSENACPLHFGLSQTFTILDTDKNRSL